MRQETYESILDSIRATPDTPAGNIAECGHCHFRWDDTISTELTPAPSARCPNEYNHIYVGDTVEFPIAGHEKGKGIVSRVWGKPHDPMVTIREPSSLTKSGYRTFVRYASVVTKT